MIYNQDIDLIQKQPYEILIVGGGAVGLSLASSLAYNDINICVIESGLENKDRNYDKLKNVKTNGLNIKSESRERMLGGCGQTWAGQLANFDQPDIIYRSQNYPSLGIDYEEVENLLNKFGKFFKIPNSKKFNINNYKKSKFELTEIFEQKVFLRQNPIFKFGDRLKHIFNRPYVDLIIGWTVFNLDWKGEICKGIIIKNQRGENKFLAAKKIILCSGTIENIRLLKISQIEKKLPSSLPLGERFMSHPKGIAGKIVLNEPVSLDDTVFKLPEKQGFSGCVGFKFADSYIKKNNLSNVYLRFVFEKNKFFNDSSRNLAKYLREFPGIKNMTFVKWFAKFFSSFWKFRDGIIGLTYGIILRILKKCGISKKTTRSVTVEIYAEMSSEQSNYVSLIGEMFTGDPTTPLVNHSLSQNDLRSIEKFLDKLNEILKQKNIGRLIISKKSISELVSNDASHHIGGTRISLKGDDGVVSSDLKVIGSENLYVCGGSILRSSGHANPTMFLVGMALKLAKQISGEIKTSFAKNSLFYYNFEEIKIQPEIVIIGAGRRVREDVLPVFETLIKNNEAISIFARNESGIFGLTKPYLVKPLKDLSSSDISKTKIIYVAIPVVEAIPVAKLLKQIVPENVKIVWDTPIAERVFESLKILKNHKKFVAEDSSYLPWIELLKSSVDKNLSKILFDRGGYKYHATALAKALYMKIQDQDINKKSEIKKSKNTLSYKLNDQVRVIIKSPRSYEEGSIKILFDDGSEQILGGNNINSSIQIIRNEIGQCCGFSLGSNTHDLSPIETDLIGHVNPKDDIVSLMLKIKKVGLRRLIFDVFNNHSKLEIREANFDAKLF